MGRERFNVYVSSETLMRLRNEPLVTMLHEYPKFLYDMTLDREIGMTSHCDLGNIHFHLAYEIEYVICVMNHMLKDLFTQNYTELNKDSLDKITSMISFLDQIKPK